MKVGKPKSKRVPVRLRNKIQKSSAAKQRKQRKEAKKNPEWRSRLKKDPGIPNLFPYKAKILAEIEESKRRKEEELMQKRENAKARREGRAVADSLPTARSAGQDELLDDDVEEDEDVELDQEDEDEDMEDDGSNPMAALVASAQARANTFEHDDEEEEEEDDEEQPVGLSKGLQPKKAASEQPVKKILPKQALEDPVKAVSLLMNKMQATTNGVDTMIEHYELLPLVTAGSDVATRFLVEVARKRGRLGRGGIPNLHAAALIVLNDLLEERLQLPAQSNTAPSAPAPSGEVTIVKTMAAPFRLEGLWGSAEPAASESAAMAVDG